MGTDGQDTGAVGSSRRTLNVPSHAVICGIWPKRGYIFRGSTRCGLIISMWIVNSYVRSFAWVIGAIIKGQILKPLYGAMSSGYYLELLFFDWREAKGNL